MIVLDSSAWLAYFSSEANRRVFEPVVDGAEVILVPTICLYEVYKVMLRELGEVSATEAAMFMRQGCLVPFHEPLAYSAAELSVQHRLRTAEALIYATARAFEAELWSQDRDFYGLPGVRFIAKEQ